MKYPWKAEPIGSCGAGIQEVAVCGEECANAAGLVLIDELTDGWIDATAEAGCPGCGRLIIIEGVLTGAHYHDANEGVTASREISAGTGIRRTIGE